MNHIRLVVQPEGSLLCGQCCVAMVCDRSLEETIGAFLGKRGRTSWKEIRAALHVYKKPHRFFPFPTLGEKMVIGLALGTFIFRVRSSETKMIHYCVRHNGVYFDPAGYAGMTLHPTYAADARFTSWLVIT